MRLYFWPNCWVDDQPLILLPHLFNKLHPGKMQWCAIIWITKTFKSWCLEEISTWAEQLHLLQGIYIPQQRVIRKLSMGIYFYFLMRLWAGYHRTDFSISEPPSPPPFPSFVWLDGKFLKNGVDHLYSRRTITYVCIMCWCDEETENHLLLKFPFSWWLWTSIFSWFGLSWGLPNKNRQGIITLGNKVLDFFFKKKIRFCGILLVLVVIWFLQKERDTVFQK